MFDPEAIALEAYALSKEKRETFLAKICGEDAGKRALVAASLLKLQEVAKTLPPGAVGSDPGKTVELGNVIEPHPVDVNQQAAPDPSAEPSSGARSVAISALDESVSPDIPDTLSPDNLSFREKMDAEEILDRFESELGDAEEIDWVQYVPLEEDARIVGYLAYHLVRLEIQHKIDSGRSIDHERYLSRLPQFRQVIESAIRDSSELTSLLTIRQGSTSVVSSLSSGPTSDWIISNRGNHGKPAASQTSERYRPLAKHAQGGLGAVYRGEDMELGRTVALKRILPEYENYVDCRDRFVFEAAVTGSLEHPGIVPIYGLNTYDGEKPYYAMRFIRGRSFGDAIKEFHHENPDAVASSFDSGSYRRLLRRLIETCNAIHYAHERGVLHRDLKPDNVMLGKYGETLVVDWGLAMLMPEKGDLDDDVGELKEKPIAQSLPISSSKNKTSEGSTVGTPYYMSPEQARGVHQGLTPATDVYALGAMLFRITSNEHCVQGRNTLEVVTKVRNGQTRDLGQVSPAAPRAMVSICRRAMMPQPKDRYATAIELAEDIDRWLNDEPVLAHADSETVQEKAGRAIRKYRSWTVSAAAALLAIAAIAVIATIFIQRAKAKEEVAKVQAQVFKDEALQRYRQSQNVIDTWLVQSDDALQFFPGTRSVRSRLLKIAAEDYAKLSEGISKDPEIELERIRAMIRLGDLQQMAEDYEMARGTYTKAIEVLNKTKIAAGNEKIQVAFDSEAGHAQSRIGVAWTGDGQLDKANVAFEAAINRLTPIANREIPSTLRYLAAANINSAEAALQVNEFKNASAKLIESVSRLESLADKTEPRDVMMKSLAFELLGRMKRRQGDLARSREDLRQATTWVHELVEQSPDQPEFTDRLASLMILQAGVARDSGLPEEEQDAFNTAVDLYRSLQKAIPDLPIYQENLSLALTNLGVVLDTQHRCRDARVPLEEALQRLDGLIQAYGNLPHYQNQIAATQDRLGIVLASLGENKAAEQQLSAALIAYGALMETFPNQVDYRERLAITQSHLAQVFADKASSPETPEDVRADSLGKATNGFEFAIRTLENLVEVFPEVTQYSRALAYVYFERAQFQSRLGESDDARSDWEAAERIWKSLAVDGDVVSSERLAWLQLIRPGATPTQRLTAVEFAEIAVERSPENRKFIGTLAVALLANQRTTEAKKLVVTWREKPEKLNGRDWQVLSLLGDEDSPVAEDAKRSADWYADQAPNHRERIWDFEWL